ncbi:restriction endonuclease subunit S [Streptococcus parauberis]|uniref:restriction endonuclease subunit S n=1 Tax=Streptococcus parauberis TaxID=1348 RepID=UPI0037A40E99
MMSKKSPQLRFEGFTDDWVQRKLGDLVDSYNKIVSGKSNYPVATSSRRGLFLQSDYFDGSRSGIDENVDFHKVPEKYITYRHMSDDSIFKFNQNDFDTPVLVSKEYPVFRSNQQANQTFLLDHLNNSPEFLKFSTLQKLGGTRVRLYFKNLQAYKLMMPNIEEQNAIASFFTTVDNLIAANQRKLDLLKEQKKGFLQKMFPKNGAKVPELRFAGFADDWEQRKLGDLLKEFSIKSKIEDEHKVLSSTNSGMEFREGRVSGTSNLGYKIIKNGDLVLSPQNLWLGNININNIGKGLVSPSYKTFEFINIDSSFINPQLRTQKMLEEYKNSSTQGASVVRRNLEIDSFYQIKIFVPTISEQEKIGSFFKQIDDTIDLHQRKLDLLKEQKKGFLQKMFV